MTLSGLLLSLVVAGCSDEPVVFTPEPEPNIVTGFVYLAGTDEPLEGVEVSIAGKIDTTSARGKFEIDSIPAGIHTITASRVDYFDYSEEIEVEGLTVYNIDLMIAIEVGRVYGRVTHPRELYVGSASVTIDAGGTLYSDITDIDGSYSISNVPIGSHELTCTQFNYHEFAGDVVVKASDIEYDIVMVRTYHDTIGITKDSWTEYTSLYPNVADSNHGGDYYLSVQAHPTNDLGTYRARAYVGLPATPPLVTAENLESATLVLSEYPLNMSSTGIPRDPPTLTTRRVITSWSENTITFNRSPSISDEEFAHVSWQGQDLWKVRINVFDAYFDGIDLANGIIIGVKKDIEGEGLNTGEYDSIYLYSGEYSQPSSKLKPYVVLVYTI